MKVFIKLTAWFRKYTEGKSEIAIQLPMESNVSDAIKAIGIPEAEVGFVTINGIKPTEGALLADGDKIAIYTTIIGG